MDVFYFRSRCRWAYFGIFVVGADLRLRLSGFESLLSLIGCLGVFRPGFVLVAGE